MGCIYRRAWSMEHRAYSADLFFLFFFFAVAFAFAQKGGASDRSYMDYGDSWLPVSFLFHHESGFFLFRKNRVVGGFAFS